MIRPLHLVLAVLLPLAAGGALAQQALVYDAAEDIQRALAEAQSEGLAARQRAEKLEAEAASATEAAEKTAREAAGAAARIQQAEAAIAADQARIGLIEQQRKLLRVRLAEKQRPLVRLTASLQRLARRPPVLSMLRPGSLRDTMYLRAILATMLPEVERRTASLRPRSRVPKPCRTKRGWRSNSCARAKASGGSGGSALPRWKPASASPRAVSAGSPTVRPNGRWRWPSVRAISMGWRTNWARPGNCAPNWPPCRVRCCARRSR